MNGTASTWIYYIDESHDDHFFCLAALGIRSDYWRGAFEMVKKYRQTLKISDGVLMRAEIHARDLTSGRGRLGPDIIGKYRRCQIFYELLNLAASLPTAHRFSICLPISGRKDPQLDAWDRLLNRIDRTNIERTNKHNKLRAGYFAQLEGKVSADIIARIYAVSVPYASHSILIADEGRELEISRSIRRHAVYNHIPSQYGQWGSGSGATKNIPLGTFIEDAVFKNSEHSYFIQLADCIAFALLKSETPPSARVRKYRLDKAFKQSLESICFKKATRKDPRYLGIVRA